MAIQCGNWDVEAEHSISAWQGVPQLCVPVCRLRVTYLDNLVFAGGGSSGGANRQAGSKSVT